MTRFKANPNCMSNQIAHSVPTVSLTDAIAEIVTCGDLHCISPEAYFLWVEEIQDSGSRDMEVYWY